MNIIEASMESIRQFARENCAGQCIDEHWEVVLSEMEEIVTVEILLTLHRRYVNESMRRWAQEIARSLPRRDISDLDDATLVIHATARWLWMRFVSDPKFRDFVDNYAQGLIYPPDSIGWAKTSRLWLPIAQGTYNQIPRVLINHYKHSRFAQQCWNEVKHRHSAGNDIEKHAFVVLSDCEDLRQQRKEGIHWLRSESQRIAPDVGEDAMQDVLENFLALPLHMQIQKIGATRKAIHDRAIDIRRKGGKCELVSLDADVELTNTIPDASLEPNDNGIIRDEFRQLLSDNQLSIEEILSLESPKKRRLKIGKRRFKVMQMLAYEPNLTSTEIANQLKVGNQTIGRDRDVIHRCQAQIREVIHS